MKQQVSGRVLLVDDDRDVILSAQMILKKEFGEIRSLSNPSDLEQELTHYSPHVVLLDMNFTRGMTSGDEGFYWLRKIKQIDPGIQVVMSTAYGEIDLAVKAIKLGASDFVQKPWLNEKLVATLKSCLKLGESHREITQLKSIREALTEELNRTHDELVGSSAEFQFVRDLINKVAGTDANVLITGENGTGKDLVARAIHAGSPRKNGPLVSVDIGAIPVTLFESEMFGHVKGAFTDARENRQGKFELATGGTLFLDEIGNLDLNTQAKLLRALESRSITHVGGSKSLPIDVRLISATNVAGEDLANPVNFRQDLLYRINTVEIRVPALRERPDDIPLLLEHFLENYSKKYNKQGMSIPQSTINQLRSYAWPGNVRELKHATERAVIVSNQGALKAEDFVSAPKQPEHNTTTLNLTELEKSTIQQAILRHNGNLSQAAKALGLGRTTLYRKMEKYDLTDK